MGAKPAIEVLGVYLIALFAETALHLFVSFFSLFRHRQRVIENPNLARADRLFAAPEIPIAL